MKIILELLKIDEKGAANRKEGMVNIQPIECNP